MSDNLVIGGATFTGVTGIKATDSNNNTVTYLNPAQPGELPAGYTQLKYLQSSGTQAINTGVAPTLETKLQIQGYALPGNGQYYPLGGCTNPSCSVGSTNGWSSPTGYWSFGNVTDKQLNVYKPYDTAPILAINKNTATMTTFETETSSTSIGATAMSGNASTRIYLFARGSAGSFDRKSKCRIFRAKIWDDGTLVRDFVPAMYDSTEEIGMYDIVNNVFYSNVGTGVFVGGEY